MPIPTWKGLPSGRVLPSKALERLIATFCGGWQLAPAFSQLGTQLLCLAARKPPITPMDMPWFWDWA